MHCTKIPADTLLIELLPLTIQETTEARALYKKLLNALHKKLIVLSKTFSEQFFLQETAALSGKHPDSHYFIVSSEGGVFIKKQHTKGSL
jgi:predicted mannosyl-3-phosphoglycerate phosphatase (HAD superfamily)